MLRLPFERDGWNGLRFRLALRRVLLLSWLRSRGREFDREMLRERSRDRDCERDVIETSNESPVR